MIINGESRKNQDIIAKRVVEYYEKSMKTFQVVTKIQRAIFSKLFFGGQGKDGRNHK